MDQNIILIRPRRALNVVILAGLVAMVGLRSSLLLAADVESIDWSQVPESKPRLFYPGQSSYEWLRTEEHKKATEETRAGEACLR